MGLFAARPPPSRGEALSSALRAVEKGRPKKALQLLFGLVEREPRDAGLRVRAAGLLAELGRSDEAVVHLREAAALFGRQGFEDRERAALTQATRVAPQDVELWEALAALERRRGRPGDAVRVLLRGRRAFAGRHRRAGAIRLLKAVFALEPWRPDATLDLASALARSGDKLEAKQLYEGLCGRVSGSDLREARAGLFALAPTPAAAWRWMRAAFAGR